MKRQKSCRFFVWKDDKIIFEITATELSMGLFDFLKSKKKIQNQISPNQAFVMGEDFPFIDATSNELKLSAVYAAITTISSTMSKIPFFIIDTKTKERKSDGNIYRLLNTRPNGVMNASTMNALIMNWVLMDGEAFVVPIRRPRSNEIVKRIPYAKSDVDKSINKDTYELVYKIKCKDGITRTYAENEVEHYTAFSIDGINGISPLEYARQTVQTGLNQDEFNRHFYEKGGRPSDYLSYEADLSMKEKEVTVGKDDKGDPIKVKKSYKDLIREEWDKGKRKGQWTAVLDNGAKYNTVEQITPEQMQFVTSKDITVQDIARFFRMGSCMFKLGVGKQSYSTNEQGQICYINETIAPFLRQWEQELTLKLLTEEQRRKGWQIKGNLNAELRGDTAARLAWYKGMREMGVYNINEVRDYEDLSSIGENGDVRTIGPNAVPLERAINGDSAAAVTPNNVSGEENDDDNNEEQDDE